MKNENQHLSRKSFRLSAATTWILNNIISGENSAFARPPSASNGLFRLECPFDLLPCYVLFPPQGLHDWLSHSLMHFTIDSILQRDEIFDSGRYFRNTCPFCNAVFKDVDFLESWKMPMAHVDQHQSAGRTLQDGKAAHGHQYDLWQVRAIHGKRIRAIAGKRNSRSVVELERTILKRSGSDDHILPLPSKWRHLSLHEARRRASLTSYDSRDYENRGILPSDVLRLDNLCQAPSGEERVAFLERVEGLRDDVDLRKRRRLLQEAFDQDARGYREDCEQRQMHEKKWADLLNDLLKAYHWIYNYISDNASLGFNQLSHRGKAMLRDLTIRIRGSRRILWICVSRTF